MSDDKEKKETVVPKMMTDLEWVWVLVSPVTKNRDSIFVLDIDERDNGGRRRIIPIFENREDAAKIKLRICQDKAGNYTEQTMNLSEVGRFAAQNKLEIMLLDEAGTIVAHMEAKLEQASVH